MPSKPWTPAYPLAVNKRIGVAFGAGEQAFYRLADEQRETILGVPGNTVKTRMFHARKKLSELLEAQGVVGALA